MMRQLLILALIVGGITTLAIGCVWTWGLATALIVTGAVAFIEGVILLGRTE